MKITPEMVRNAYITKGLKPIQGQYNLTVDWDADGGPEFVAGAVTGQCCAISALVHGEKLTDNDKHAALPDRGYYSGAAETHLGINYMWDGKMWYYSDDRFSTSNFDNGDEFWEAVKDLAE